MIRRINNTRGVLTLLGLIISVSLFGQRLPSAMIDVAGTRVFVQGGGIKKDSIPIILVHAGFQDHAMWFEQTKDLMKDHVVITLDLPGHGKTQDGPEPPLAAEVIKAVMDSLFMEKANFVGLSLGAAVVTDFAIAHPTRVSKLVLAAAGIDGWHENRQPDTLTKKYITELQTALQAKDTAAAAEVFTHYWFDGVSRSPGDVSPVLRELLYTTTRNNMRLHKGYTTWPRFTQPAAIHNLAKINVPVLILTGTLDLPEIITMNGYLYNNLPNAKQVMVSGAAHMINLENPVRFNEEVRKFFKDN